MVFETVCYVTELNDTIRNVITRSETRYNLIFVVIFTQFDMDVGGAILRAFVVIYIQIIYPNNQAPILFIYFFYISGEQSKVRKLNFLYNKILA